MRYLLSLLIIVVLGCGTDQGEKKTYSFTIVNDSGVPITIMSYIKDKPEMAPIVITLNEGEKFSKSIEEDLPPPPSPYTFGNLLGTKNQKIDSIRVIYDNQRLEMFEVECSENSENILNFCFYNSINQLYTFTSSNYNRAIICDGTCN